MAESGSGPTIARAYIALIPSMQGSQKTVATELGAQVEPAAKEAGEKSGKSLGDGIAKGLKTTGKVIGAAMAAVSAAAVASTKAFVSAAKETANYGDTVDKQSQKVGLSAKTWQEYDYVLKICGTEMSSMTTGLKTLTNQIDAAKNGNKEAVDRFKALGISMKDLKNLSREDLFKKTISGLQGMKEGTDRAALANKLFGKSGQELTPLFNMTAKETQGLIDKANDLGMVMSDTGVKASAAYVDSLTTLEGTLKGLKNNIMTQFMPGLTAMTEGLADVMAGKGSKKLTDGIRLFMVELKRMAPDILKTLSDVGITIIQGLGPLLPDLVSMIFSLTTQAIVTVSSMLPQLMPSIISGIQGAMVALMQALPIVIQGVTDLIMSLVTWLNSGDNVSTLVSGIVSLTSQIANSIGMVLPVLLPAVVEIIGKVAIALTDEKNVSMLIDAALTVIGAVAVAIGKALAKIPEIVVGVIKNLGNLLAKFLDWAVPLAATGIEAIVNTVKSWGNSAKTFILNLINGIKTSITNWISNLKKGFVDGFNAIKSNISSILSNISDFVKGAIDTIKSIPGKVVSIGKDLVVGLWNGINDKINWVKDKIKGMGESITKAIKKVFGVASPSKVFAEVGSFLAQGLSVGYESEMKDVRKEMLSASNGLTAAMTTEITAHASSGSLADVSAGDTYNGGPITIIVNAAEGQSVNAIADAVIDKLTSKTTRKGRVYA